MSKLRLFTALLLGVAVGLWSSATAEPAIAEIEVWWHTGKPEELAVMTAQVEEFNQMYEGQIRARLVSIPEADYTDEVRAAALADALPDVLDLDGPTLASFVWAGQIRALDDLVPDGLRNDLLPSIIDQGTYPPDGQLYAIGVFDSGLALWGNREYLEQVGVRIPDGVEDAWTLDEFNRALDKLAALDEVAWPLDLKLNYGVGEWFTYGFSPLVQSFGGDLIDRTTWRAQGTLDGIESILALTLFQHWVDQGWVVPAARDDDAFYGPNREAALAWVGHWMWEPHSEGLGDDWVLIPTPRFGSRHVTGMGSWAWSVTERSDHPEEAWAFIEFLLQPEEIVRMTDANGAVPSRFSAIEISELYGPGGPLELFAQQLEVIGLERPVHPVYPVITSAFAEAVDNIIHGADVRSELERTARRVDEDIEDHGGYPPFGD